jgi:hypothetical protein
MLIVNSDAAPSRDCFDNGKDAIDGVGDVDCVFSVLRRKFLQLFLTKGVIEPD